MNRRDQWIQLYTSALAGDYEARLAGTTPLDAPPAKAGA
jgi:hypothetical protein